MISTEYTLRASHAGLSFSLRSRLGRHDQPIVCFWPPAAVPECLLARQARRPTRAVASPARCAGEANPSDAYADKCGRRGHQASPVRSLLHEPSVAHHDGLAGERVRWERRQKYRDFRHVLRGRELAVDGFLQHHCLYDVRLRDPEFARLLWDLFLDERRPDEARADHVRTDPMRGSLLGDDLGQADKAVLG